MDLIKYKEKKGATILLLQSSLLENPLIKDLIDKVQRVTNINQYLEGNYSVIEGLNTKDNNFYKFITMDVLKLILSENGNAFGIPFFVKVDNLDEFVPEELPNSHTQNDDDAPVRNTWRNWSNFQEGSDGFYYLEAQDSNYRYALSELASVADKLVFAKDIPKTETED